MSDGRTEVNENIWKNGLQLNNNPDFESFFGCICRDQQRSSVPQPRNYVKFSKNMRHSEEMASTL